MVFFKDFKKFIARGNLMDLAVGIMVGAAFNSLVSSFVENILTPFISVFLGKTNISSWKVEFKLPLISDGVPPEKIILSYGKFLQTGMDFLILAFIIFIIVKLFNNLIEKAQDPKNNEVPTPKDIQLLSDMREALVNIEKKIK